MLLQKEKQSIEEIGKKDKKIYERRKVSLSNIYDLLFPQKSRKYFRTNAKEHIGEVSSVKVSFCTSFRGKIKKGSLAVETALVLPLFFLGMVTLISFMDIYKLQTEHLTALCTKVKHGEDVTEHAVHPYTQALLGAQFSIHMDPTRRSRVSRVKHQVLWMYLRAVLSRTAASIAQTDVRQRCRS